jgi:hypothetical protein
MDISSLLEGIALMINMPIPLLVLIPVSFALAFQILKASEANKIAAKAMDVKCWDGDKNANDKPSTIAMLASLVFIVFASFSMYNASNDKPLIPVNVFPIQIMH